MKQANSEPNPPADIPDLSPRSADILRFLYEYTAAHNGMSPTMRTIGDAVGISSTSVTKYNLNILKECGYITLSGAGRQRHIGIVGAQYSNPPLPGSKLWKIQHGEYESVPGTAVPDDDVTRIWNAMADHLCKGMQQKLEAEILGAGGESKCEQER